MFHHAPCSFSRRTDAAGCLDARPELFRRLAQPLTLDCQGVIRLEQREVSLRFTQVLADIFVRRVAVGRADLQFEEVVDRFAVGLITLVATPLLVSPASIGLEPSTFEKGGK